MFLKHVMNLRMSLAAVKVLLKEVGLGKTLSLVKGLAQEKKKGNAWDELPEPKDEKDDQSRELIEDAVYLYRALLKIMKGDEAEILIKKVIKESAIRQLYSLVPIIDKERILSLPIEEREENIKKLVGKFPNADWEIMESTGTTFAYRITRCRLVELVRALGYPELADAFCPGDITYFKQFQPAVMIERPKTIGYGNKCCEFIFTLK